MRSKFTRTSVSTKEEQRILTGLIIDDSFCSQVLPLAKPEYFKLDYAKPVLRWVQSHFEKYEYAPKSEITDLFELNSKKVDKDLQENIANFLDKISSDHETEVFNTGLQIDMAKNYFRKRALLKQCDKIKKLIDMDRLKEAEEAAEVDIVVESNLNDDYNPFDLDEIISSFANDGDRSILNFDGALGELLGGIERNNLVAITGVEKKGKTQWLQEFAIRAATENKLKVAMFSFEMSKEQTKERAHSMIAGRAVKQIERVVFPVFDCKANQTGECGYKKRTNKVNNLLSGVEPGKIPIFEEHPDYKPCTECRGKTNDFKAAIWYYEQENVPAMDKNFVHKKAKYIKGLKNIRVKNYAAYSEGMRTMERDIKSYISRGFVPDVIICDYLDIMQKEGGASEREELFKIWQHAKRLAGVYNVVFITADQADAKARDQKSLKQGNFSESKQKDSVLDVRIGLNQTSQELEQGIMRLNLLYKRMGKAITTKEVIVTQCFELGQVCMDSEWLSD